MELLINGKFNNEELKELEQQLQQYNVKVCRYYTKGVEVEEIVRLIFRDFDAYTLLRDGTLFTLLIWIAKRAINWVKSKKGENVKIQASSVLGFKQKDKGNVCINLGIPSNDNQQFWHELETTLTIEFVNGVKKEEIVSITWDKNKEEIKIIRF